MGTTHLYWILTSPLYLQCRAIDTVIYTLQYTGVPLYHCTIVPLYHCTCSGEGEAGDDQPGEQEPRQGPQCGPRPDGQGPRHGLHVSF